MLDDVDQRQMGITDYVVLVDLTCFLVRNSEPYLWQSQDEYWIQLCIFSTIQTLKEKADCLPQRSAASLPGHFPTCRHPALF